MYCAKRVITMRIAVMRPVAVYSMLRDSRLSGSVTTESYKLMLTPSRVLQIKEDKVAPAIAAGNALKQSLMDEADVRVSVVQDAIFLEMVVDAASAKLP